MWEPSPTFPQNRQERPPHALFQNTAGMESKPPKNKGPAQTPEGEALAEELSRHGWLRTWQTSSFRFPLPFCNWDVPCRNLRAPLCRMRTFQAFVPDHFLHSFRHQSLPPILFREHIPNLTAFFICKFGKVIFIVLLNTERTNYFALIFQSKSLLVTDEHIQNYLGFFLGFVGLPACHLTNAVNRSI